MYTRLVMFTGATNIDEGVQYLRDEAVPVLNSQNGYRGVSASADRENGSFGILSLWDTEAARDASNSALGKARGEALEIVGGDLTVENFEQVAQAITKPPVVGCTLIVSRVAMDPASVDDNVAFFKSQIMPQIQAADGFCALRNMINRKTGEGMLGTVFETRDQLDAFAAGMDERRAPGIARGITFGETSVREIVYSEIK